MYDNPLLANGRICVFPQATSGFRPPLAISSRRRRVARVLRTSRRARNSRALRDGSGRKSAGMGEHGKAPTGRKFIDGGEAKRNPRKTDNRQSPERAMERAAFYRPFRACGDYQCMRGFRFATPPPVFPAPLRGYNPGHKRNRPARGITQMHPLQTNLGAQHGLPARDSATGSQAGSLCPQGEVDL